MTPVLKIKRLSPKIGADIPAPRYATAGAAAIDLSACVEAPLTLAPGDMVTVPCGIAAEIPQGWAGLVFARSGLATKQGVTLSNAVGVIDSDYRGEICVGLVNISRAACTVRPGDRIAQLALVPAPQADIVLCDELSPTGRGQGGFGSTGA